MSEQALYRLLRFFMQKNQSSLMPLLLLLRKKSRSRRLLICKRIRNAFGSLPTFCDSAFGTKFHMFFLSSFFNHTHSMSEQALYRLLRFFYTKNQSSLIPLLLLLRKKSRSARLFVCKRTHLLLTVATNFLQAYKMLHFRLY